LGVYTGKAVCPLIALTVLVTKLNQIMRLYSQAAENNKLLRALVDKDGLTGLSNRRRFDELLDMEFRRACSLSIPLGLVLIDVDFFKSYNDSYGHLAGDECLRRISSAISGVLRRAGDEAARYGGEEIAVLLPATTADATLTIAEKICRAVSALGIEHRDGVNGIATISAGVSVLNAFDGSARPSDLVGAADKALYLAKRLGKNRVCSLGLDKVNSPVCDPV
jgi:diguanylate cyclase (GGDEF)-like protein